MIKSIEELSIIIEGLRLRVKQLQGSVKTINESIENLETEDGTKAPAIMQTTSPAAITSFSDGGEDMPIKSLKCTIVPVQAGTGDPAPDNVRPIAGWDGVTVQRCGKNLIENISTSKTNNGITYTVNSDGTVVTSGTATGISVFWVTGNLYMPYTEWLADAIMSGCPSDGSTSTYRMELVFYDDHNNALGTRYDVGSGIPINDVPDGTVKYAVCIRILSGISANNLVFKPMIRLSSFADSTFEPYSADSHSLSFPSTVYGGWVDVVKGELHITHEQIASYNGETLPGVWISDRDVYAEGTTPTTGAQVVYELAQEIVLQLDPVTITTLLGTNNVYCDSGTVAVEYAADTKMYIDNAVASVTPEPEPSPEQDDAPPEEEEEEEAEPAPEEDTAEPEVEEEEAVPVVKKASRKK